MPREFAETKRPSEKKEFFCFTQCASSPGPINQKLCGGGTVEESFHKGAIKGKKRP